MTIMRSYSHFQSAPGNDMTSDMSYLGFSSVLVVRCRITGEFISQIENFYNSFDSGSQKKDDEISSFGVKN